MSYIYSYDDYGYVLATELDAYNAGNQNLGSSTYTATSLCTKKRANALGCCVNTIPVSGNDNYSLQYNLSTYINGAFNFDTGLTGTAVKYSDNLIVRKCDLMFDPGKEDSSYRLILIPIDNYTLTSSNISLGLVSINTNVLKECNTLYSVVTTGTVSSTSYTANDKLTLYYGPISGLSSSNWYLVYREAVPKDSNDNSIINLPMLMGSTVVNTDITVNPTTGTSSVGSATNLYVQLEISTGQTSFYVNNILLFNSSAYGSITTITGTVSPCYPHSTYIQSSLNNT